MKKKFIYRNSLLKSVLIVDRKCHTICHQFWQTNGIEMKLLLVMSVKLYPYLYKYAVILRASSCCFYKKLLGGTEQKKENVFIFY